MMTRAILTIFVLGLFLALVSSAVAQGEPPAPPPPPVFHFEIGKSAPDGILNAAKDARGEEFLPDAMLLHFVACESMRCTESLRAVDEFIARPLADKSLWVVAIAVDASAEEAAALAEETSVSFPLIADPDRTLFSAIADRGVPRTIVLDAKGKIAYAHAGYQTGREAEFHHVVRSVLEGKPTGIDAAAKIANKPTIDADLMARDVRGQQAPEVPVETWINPPPDDAKGKFLLVDFWATWCPPCRESLRQGEALHDRFADRLVTWAISDEPAAKVEDYVKKNNLAQPVGTDGEGRAMKSLAIEGIPHAFLADPSGIVIWQGNPLELWAEDGRLLSELLTPR